MKRQGRHEEARAHFKQVVTDGGLPLLEARVRAALHFHLGELDLCEGRLTSAVTGFEACLRDDPTHSRARTLLTEALDRTEVAA